MKPAKAMTIRLSADQAEELETVALVDDQPISEIIRAAISEHILTRKADSSFQDGLKDRIERAQRMLGSDQ
ncbi:ribbon-helix-helix protein, CopG family [Jatrophihabitans cynanchi]|uniref:Ribbon-helix-helix protein, CopG family n=1 Tax=Jatrophihabitans cynanchi TaxID=2944128 RepID=A0ABY7K1H3_9ACTN|nr:ribbon-helix-helix protein, CopG family [Jatrophihabitans sp. SB3-54]WAX58519.1 ribbon-helix-helix protein, CopG family [Jatrophihabitans sp. SB3-54]